MTEPAAAARAADALAAGDVVVVPFNGIFVLVGDADDPAVPEKIAVAKQRPQAKGVALVCPPEFLAEHVVLEGPNGTLPRVRALYGAVHAVGVILPAARPGAPRGAEGHDLERLDRAAAGVAAPRARARAPPARAPRWPAPPRT